MKHRYSTFALAPLMAVILMTAPVAGYAKEQNKDNGKKVSVTSTSSVRISHDNNDNENENDDHQGNDKNKNRENTGCWKAFGHLIAPGWIRINGTASISGSCNLPFGIAKKFHGTTTAATSTPDTTAPVISNLTATSTRKHEGTIKWSTNEKSDSVVWISTVSPVSTSGTPSVTRAARVTDHRIVIGNLAASTTYYAVVQSRDAAGNAVTSGQISFTTTGEVASTTNNTLTISNVVAVVSTSTVNIGWKTNRAADSQIYYSNGVPVVPASASTTAVVNATLVTDHMITVSNLATSTPYNFVIQSKDASNNMASTGQFSVTTGM